ncbi:hypothetical protein ACFY7Z_10830 [Streptomyces sp. NPDC012623]|uniref:hypothetical protein n=1 Tax=unclassified Streptomyces TaxID=2593676 RepID=UPI0036BABCAB
MPVVEELAAELAVLLRIPHDSTVGEVWEAAGTKWAVPADRFTETYERVAKACNDYARNHLVEVPADDTLLLDATPAYMTSVITGGQDIAVDYLTNSPRACLYITQGKATSLLTLINILVHEYSHGINFVLSAERAASPLLNLAGPMQVPLTEGQAFWREWEYWHAAADLFGRKDLDASQQAYLKLYGATPAAQAQAIRAAQFETYIWRVVRHLRAMCDVQVNMGWRTVVDFLDWAAERTGLSKEFLFGECFTFLAQPGYAPAYGIDGMRYGELQRKSAKTQHDFNTTASGMGFYPWTQCVTRLSA